MENKKYFFVLCIGFLIANCAASCSSTNVGNPPLDNRNSKDVLMGTVTNALLGNTDQQTIEKNNKLFEENRDRDISIKSSSDNDSNLNTTELSLLLKLNTSQKKVFDKSFENYFAGKTSIVESLSLDEYEKKEKIMLIAKKRDDSIIAVLDTFQIDMYKNYLLKNQ
ncbi:MAG: hypothetical protein EBS55_13585 [Flavobacteriaceae bacterium]|nr:hypothetical protein [Flavobacteriaceae bacterium]